MQRLSAGVIPRAAWPIVLAVAMSCLASTSEAKEYWRENLWGEDATPDDKPRRRIEIVTEQPAPFLKGVATPRSNFAEWGQDWSLEQLTWGGHDQREPRWPATIAFKVKQVLPGKRNHNDRLTVTYFLSVVDVATKPRLVLTDDPKQASTWTMDATRSKSDHSVGNPREDRWGYVQLANSPDRELWLEFSDMQVAEQGSMRWKHAKLGVSDKKRDQFHYSRLVPQSK